MACCALVVAANAIHKHKNAKSFFIIFLYNSVAPCAVLWIVVLLTLVFMQGLKWSSAFLSQKKMFALKIG